MDNLPIAIILMCGGGIITVAFITSMRLYRHMVEPLPKRDITINANIWPLTLPVSCFTESGKRIRKQAVSIAVFLMAVAVFTLIYIGSVLWLG